MKVIKTDNFNRDYISETLVCSGCTPYWADVITAMLNDKYGGSQSPGYFKTVSDDHQLYLHES